MHPLVAELWHDELLWPRFGVHLSESLHPSVELLRPRCAVPWSETPQRRTASVGETQKRHTAQQAMPVAQPDTVTVAHLYAKGYAADELDIWTEEERVIVKGRRQCASDDSCVVTEFQRAYNLPEGVSAKTVRAKYERDGHLLIQGTTNAERHGNDNSRVQIEHNTENKPANRAHNEESLSKAGITLKKVRLNKNDLNAGHHRQANVEAERRFEEEVEEDGVTIEVED